MLLSLAGCDTVEAASALAGRLVALPEAEAMPLPPGQFYPWQLEGCRVVTDDGREVGQVSADRAVGGPGSVGGERRRARAPDPGGAEIVLEVDVAAGRVVIRPPDGLLDL